MEQNHDKALIKELQDVKSKVSEMYYALMGNPLSKDGGLIGRIDRIEERLEDHDKKMEEYDKKTAIMGTYQKMMWLIGGAMGSAILGYIFKIL